MEILALITLCTCKNKTAFTCTRCTVRGQGKGKTTMSEGADGTAAESKTEVAGTTTTTTTTVSTNSESTTKPELGGNQVGSAS